MDSNTRRWYIVYSVTIYSWKGKVRGRKGCLDKSPNLGPFERFISPLDKFLSELDLSNNVSLGVQIYRS